MKENWRKIISRVKIAKENAQRNLSSNNNSISIYTSIYLIGISILTLLCSYLIPHTRDSDAQWRINWKHKLDNLLYKAMKHQGSLHCLVSLTLLHQFVRNRQTGLSFSTHLSIDQPLVKIQIYLASLIDQ